MSHWTAFRFLREHEQIRKTTNRLPHWQQEGASYFVTFRLADALPESLLARFRAEREAWLRFHPEPWDEGIEAEYHKRFSTTIDRWLDAGHGECRLGQPETAGVVAGAFAHFDAERYALHAYVVMPNHVHVLLTLTPETDLKQVVTSWKSFSARRINALEGRIGPFWQRDYFDRLIRDREHFCNVARYIRRNAQRCCQAVLYLAPWLDGLGV